jgi:hypothetical protein
VENNLTLHRNLAALYLRLQREVGIYSFSFGADFTVFDREGTSYSSQEIA